MVKRLDDNIISQIKNLHKSGLNIASISKKLNVSRGAVTKYLNLENTNYDELLTSYDYGGDDSGYNPPIQSNPKQQSQSYDHSYAPIGYNSVEPLQSDSQQKMTMFIISMLNEQNNQLQQQIQNLQKQKSTQGMADRELLLKKLENTSNNGNNGNNSYREKLELRLEKMQNELEQKKQSMLLEMKAEPEGVNIQDVIDSSVSKHFGSDIITKEQGQKMVDDLLEKYQDRIDQQQEYESSKVALFRERNNLTLGLAQLDQQERKGSLLSSVIESVLTTLPTTPEGKIPTNELNKPEEA